MTRHAYTVEKPGVMHLVDASKLSAERDALLAALIEAEQWIAAELAGRLPVETLETARAAIRKAQGGEAS